MENYKINNSTNRINIKKQTEPWDTTKRDLNHVVYVKCTELLPLPLNIVNIITVGNTSYDCFPLLYILIFTFIIFIVVITSFPYSDSGSWTLIL